MRPTVRPLAVLTATLALLSPSLAPGADTWRDASLGVNNPAKSGQSSRPAPPTSADKGTLTIYTSEAVFDGAFPGLPLEDFEEGNAPPGNFSVCDSPLDATGDATCGFGAGDILAGVAFQDNPGPDAQSLILLGAGAALNASQAVIANTFADSFDIVFDPPVSAAGMFLHSTPALGQGPPDTISISVFDAADGLIGTDPAAAASGAGNFWGVSSTTPIARISMLSLNNQAEGVDNIRFAGNPTLVVSNVDVADQCLDPSANTNGIPEPGEGLVFDVELTAIAGGFTGIEATISSANPNVTIVDGVSTYPDLTSGASSTGATPFSVIVDAAAACFSQIDLDLAITSNEGNFAASTTVTLGQALAPAGLPVAIPDNNPAGIESDLVVATNVVLTDVNVRVQISHTWVGDLILTLIAPDNTEITLLDRPGVPVTSTVGCSDNNMDVTFDDAAGGDLESLCAGNDPWFVGSAAPAEALAALNGMSSAGTWTLRVSDNAGADTGTIDDWELITTPAIGGVCELCNDPGIGAGPGPNPLEIPTLDWRGLLALGLLVAAAAAAMLRR
jgi:subtilisin-like proprotein convertase family protein